MLLTGVGGGGGAAYTYIMDSVTTAGGTVVAGWGLRKLRQAYTGYIVRLRRSSDNEEANVDFDTAYALSNNSIVTVATGARTGQQFSLSSWKGTDQLFVTTLYGQGTAGYNLTQTTAANQPELKTQGSKWAIVGDGSNDTLSNSSFNNGAGIVFPLCVNYVVYPIGTSGGLFGGSSASYWTFSNEINNTAGYKFLIDNSTGYNSIGMTQNSWQQLEAFYNSTSNASALSKNRGTDVAGTHDTGTLQLFRLFQSRIAFSNAGITELIITKARHSFVGDNQISYWQIT